MRNKVIFLMVIFIGLISFDGFNNEILSQPAEICTVNSTDADKAKSKSENPEEKSGLPDKDIKKLGLMIIAHGAPAPYWNKAVSAVEKQVKEILKAHNIKHFKSVRVAFMEFAKPTIADIVKQMEKEAITDIFALPLLIAVSGHSIYDVPTILGLYHEEKMHNDIIEEGIEIVQSKCKITLGPTLDKSGIIKDILLDRVKELSTNPEEESFVILAHGDHNFSPNWVKSCKEAGTYICARTGIQHYDYAFIEIGQSFLTEGCSTILRAADKSNKVIVVNMYLVGKLQHLVENSSGSFGMMKLDAKSMFKDKNIVFANHGLLPDKRIADWIVKCSSNWAKIQ